MGRQSRAGWRLADFDDPRMVHDLDAAQLKELVGYIRASGAELMDLYDALDATGNVVEAGDYQKPGADAAEPFLWWMRMAAPGPTRWRTYARQMASPMWGSPAKWICDLHRHRQGNQNIRYRVPGHPAGGCDKRGPGVGNGLGVCGFCALFFL